MHSELQRLRITEILSESVALYETISYTMRIHEKIPSIQSRSICMNTCTIYIN
jgi:hypothetical protein